MPEQEYHNIPTMLCPKCQKDTFRVLNIHQYGLSLSCVVCSTLMGLPNDAGEIRIIGESQLIQISPDAN